MDTACEVATPRQRFEVKRLILTRANAGERIPVVIDADTRWPVPQINEYLMLALRLTRASSTLFRVAAILALFFSWGATKPIDITARLLSGQTFTRDEIATSLVTFLRTPRAAGSTKPQHITVADNELRKRIYAIREFCAYVMDDVMSRAPESRLRALEVRSNLLKRSFTKHLPKRTAPARRSALNDEQIAELVRLIAPECDGNPWARPFVKARNRVIVLLFVLCGLRRGELCKLYVSDINLEQLLISIRRRPDDVLDPRKDEPNVKTAARLLPIPPGLASILEPYILDYRRQVPGATSGPYLIVSSKNGQPLRKSSVDNIIADIRERWPVLFPELFPHLLRHTFFESVKHEMTASQMETGKKVKTGNYLMGWSGDNSSTYEQDGIVKAAFDVTREYQQKLFGQPSR